MIDFFSRLDNYMKYKGLNDNKITVEAGLANGIIGKARKRGALSQENISKLLLKYVDLDANWLFTGKGEMLTSSYNASSSPLLVQESLVQYSCSLCATKDIAIASLQETNKLLREKIKNLEKGSPGKGSDYSKTA